MFFILVFITSFLITGISVPVVIRLANRFSLVDTPENRKKTVQTHTGAVPRAGGLAIGAGFLIGALLFVPVTKPVFAILAAVVLTVAIGLLDDFRESSPYRRFAANIFVALVVIAGGIGIPFITNPFNGAIDLTTITYQFSVSEFQFSILLLADLAALLWIVWLMNAVGWSGGVDGQLPGFVAIAASVIGLLSFRFSAHDISQISVAALSFITAGAYAGFLPYNFYPQKIMPGYSGKSLAGLLLASLSILSGAKVGTALLILSIPLTDAVFTLFRRLTAGESPFRGDRGHLHHKLMELGWGRRRIAIFYWLASLLFGVIALNLTSSTGKYFAAAVIVTTVLIFLTYLHRFSST